MVSNLFGPSAGRQLYMHYVMCYMHVKHTLVRGLCKEKGGAVVNSQ